jgi:hypothetical protein
MCGPAGCSVGPSWAVRALRSPLSCVAGHPFGRWRAS